MRYSSTSPFLFSITYFITYYCFYLFCFCCFLFRLRIFSLCFFYVKLRFLSFFEKWLANPSFLQHWKKKLEAWMILNCVFLQHLKISDSADDSFEYIFYHCEIYSNYKKLYYQAQLLPFQHYMLLLLTKIERITKN